MQQPDTDTFAALKRTKTRKGRVRAVRSSAAHFGAAVVWLEFLVDVQLSADDGPRCEYAFALLGCHGAIDAHAELAWSSFDDLDAAIANCTDAQTVVLLVALQGRVRSGTSLRTG